MKILTAMYTMRKGGAYDRFIMMIEAFLERGWEVHNLSLTTIRIDQPLFRNHTFYYPLGQMNGMFSRFFVLLFFPIWALYLGIKNKIDLILAFGVLYAFILGPTKYILKKPMVTMIRGDRISDLKMRKSFSPLLWLNYHIECFALRFSDLIITNNNGLREEIFKKLPKGKKIDVRVIFNNIPRLPDRDPHEVNLTKAKLGMNGNAKVIVTAGILNQGKRIEWLIRCLKNTRLANLYLFVAGEATKKVDSRYEEFLKNLAKKLSVEDRVHFTGWLEKEELWKVYRASDLFVLPSISEGMPNAMLEALGAGLPCIGSKIPGIIDILQHDELLFDPFNEEALIKKIEFIFSDPQHLKRLTELCEERKKLFIFDWKEKVFRVVTKGHPALDMS